uniref:NPC intracellular cholesterol transporter 1 homolog 1b n=1 Tax=Anopheles coluzzii TaxID=1518534 RepID=UPI0020FFB0A5|nr:NPC intracellular cholesterol transporter 1 homolog 1b [Anopheles coluzzii]
MSGARTLKMLLLLVMVVMVVVVPPAATQGEVEGYHCVMHDVCAQIGIHAQNCPVKMAPKPLTDAVAIEIMHRRCGWMFPADDTPVCCATSQVLEMDKNFQQAEGLFSRCSTCLTNMLYSICSLACHPEQSRFLTAYTEPTTGTYVNRVDYRIDRQYVQDTFDSCKGIVLPSSGKYAMDVGCGYWEAAGCTAERWFQYMGAADNEFVPFEINYLYEEDPEQRFNQEVKHCNEAYDGSYACSCVDCDESCPTSEPPQPKDPGFMVGDLNGVTFTVAVVVGGIGLACIVLALLFGGKEGSKQQLPDLPSFFGGFPSVNRALGRTFTRWGTFCARNPVLILAICSWIVGGLAFGIQYLIITTDPVELWAAPDSRARQEKDYFDSRFSPFYRTEQIFIKPTRQEFFIHPTAEGNQTFGPAYDREFLLEVFKLQTTIEQLGQAEGRGLEQICFAPMTQVGAQTVLSECTVQSVFGYFKNSLAEFNRTGTDLNGFVVNYLDKINGCTRNAYLPSCFGTYGGPIEPGVAVGGFPQPAPGANPDFRLATGVVLTFLVENKANKDELGPALEWEQRFVDFMRDFEHPMMEVAYSAERSIEDGIDEMSEAEMYTVIISYVVMFVYITFSLGKIRGFRQFLHGSRIVLAVGGIVVVLASVACSLGFFGYLELATTMLTIEVIPFLVLAVGVDNIFMLVHAFNRIDRERTPETACAIGEALGQIGPSILLTSASECCCFAIGALSPMPAVNTFAWYATVALLVDFLLQISAFVALMALDEQRVERGRLDLVCCVRATKNPDKPVAPDGPGWLERVVERFYVPFLLRPRVRLTVLALFLVWGSLSLMVVPSIEPGLDQELSMAEDSHVVKYFRFMAELFWMGPPVYFVVKAGLNYTDVQHQNLVCGGILCNDDSISTKLYQASLYPETTHIARPASSWLDDYIDWLAIQSCCKYNPTDGSFCASNIVFCPACPEEYDETGIRPTVPQFERYLEFFLSDLPDENCAKAGRAAYSRALNYLLDRDGRLNVQDSYFSTYHTTAVTSRQFYTALEQARLIAADIQQMLDERQAGVEIFPYSVFYVFYEQYLTIWSDALQSLGLSLAAVFVVTFLVTGLDLLSALVVILLVFLIVLNMMGLMWLWNITLNAISLVNLVMSVGIGVEFISHIVRTYRLAHGTRLERSAAAMVRTGSSVFSGITLTKFAGIIVLAFAKSQIFQIFYFRMYLCIVLVGAAHGLILLPVFLTYIGPPSPPPPPPPPAAAETPRTAHTKQEEAKLDLSNTPSAANETETPAIGNEPAQHAPE